LGVDMAAQGAGPETRDLAPGMRTRARHTCVGFERNPFGAEPTRLLAAMEHGDLALLQFDLQSVELALRRQLELRGRPIKTLTFWTAAAPR